MAYSSSATAKVRNCRTATSGALSFMSSSETGELAVIGRGFLSGQGGRERPSGGPRPRRLRLAAGNAAALVIAAVDAEEGDEVLQGLGLRGQLFGSRGQLFGRGGVALRQLVDAAHGLVHLGDADGLLGRRRGHL